MTKDRPRNRPGNGRKSGGFGGREGDPTRGAGSRGTERGAPHNDPRASDSDKPWSRERAADRPAGEAARRPDGKPGGPFRGKPRFEGKGDTRSGKENFSGKPRGEFRGKPHGGKPRDDRRPHHGSHFERRDAAFEENGEVWIWGLHAANAALANPKRRISKAWISRNGAVRAGLDPEALPTFAELLDPKEIDLRLPPGAVHQGIAVRCAPLDGLDISEAAIRPDQRLVILDQVTDPQNVGAVFRSAAAFGVGGVVMQTRNAPALGGALAKAAAGAIEQVEEIRAVNLARAIDALVDAGWRVIGLDGSAEQTLDEAFTGEEPLAIVMGAEGAGIRPAVAKACTGLARIPIGVAMESLNVSNAAAIAFYEAAKRSDVVPPPKQPVPTAVGEDAVADEID